MLINDYLFLILMPLNCVRYGNINLWMVNVCMLQSGLTPLHLTAQEDKVSAAEVLAKYDANIDQQTKV